MPYLYTCYIYEGITTLFILQNIIPKISVD